jgi:hypothetical protein
VSVRGLRRGSIAASRATGGGGATYTIYGQSVDGFIRSSNTNYTTARAGSNLAAFPGETTTPFGQRLTGGTYFIFQGFLSFDTSSVVGTIQSVTLSLYGQADSSGTDFTMEARLHDWGTGITTADYVAGANVSSKTLLASLSTAGYTTSGYNDLASEAAFVSNINQSGVTRLLLVSSRFTAGTTPAGDEFVTTYAGAQTGTTNDPKLVIVTT